MTQIHEIVIPMPGRTRDSVAQFVEHYGCTLVSYLAFTGLATIRSDDPANFFWLGANVNNPYINGLHAELTRLNQFFTDLK